MKLKTKTAARKRMERAHRHIICMYNELIAENPNDGKYKLYAIIARSTNRSTNGIKRIIEKEHGKD